MPRFLKTAVGKFSCRHFGCWLVLTVSIVLSGCTSLDGYRGERFEHDELFDSVGQLRRHDDQTESAAFSNKARQISEDCGGPR